MNQAFHDALRVCMLCDEVPYLEGAPGLGKTSLMKAVARQTDARLWVVYLAQRAGNEIHGIPVVSPRRLELGGREYTLVEQAPPAYAVEVARHPGGAMVFFDELSNLPAGDAGQAMSILSERLVGEIGLPRDRVAVAAAGNPVETGAGAFRLPPALASRVVKFKVAVDAAQFAAPDAFPANWGVALEPVVKFGAALDEELRLKYRRQLAAWVMAQPDAFRLPKDPAVLADGFVCPRTVERAANLLAGLEQFVPDAGRRRDAETPLLLGALGAAGLAGFTAFRESLAGVTADEMVKARRPEDLAGTPLPRPEQVFYLILSVDAHVRRATAAQGPEPTRAANTWIGAAAACVWLLRNDAPHDLVAMLAGSLNSPDRKPARLRAPRWVAELQPVAETVRAAEVGFADVSRDDD